MKSGYLGTRRLISLLILANGLFWLAFAINFVVVSRAYKPHPPLFEEPSPPYIFWSRAFPFEQYMSPFMRATRFLQRPSFYAASPLNFCFSRRGIVVDHTYWGVSVGGYYLIAVCLLSFAQWYVIGWVVQKIWYRWSGHPTPSPSHPPST